MALSLIPDAFDEPPRHEFRCVREQHCKIFRLADKNNGSVDALAVGTTKCHTSVGVYFELDANYCFIANIKVPNTGENDKESPDHEHQIFSGKKVTELKDQVIANLQYYLASNFDESFGVPSWRPTKRMQDSLVLVCQRHRAKSSSAGGYTKPLVGHHIIRALEDFFDVEDDEKYHARMDGFIIEAMGDPPMLLGVRDSTGDQMDGLDDPEVDIQAKDFRYLALDKFVQDEFALG